MTAALVWSLSLTLAGTVALVVFAFKYIAKLRAAGLAQLEREVLRGRTAQRLEEGANFFGKESIGPMQLRGNGTLALTNDELAFVLWLPRRTMVIPLRDLVAVDEVKSHLGKTIARPLLRVRFQVAGVEDTIAWYVRDLGGWRGELERVIQRRTGVGTSL